MLGKRGPECETDPRGLAILGRLAGSCVPALPCGRGVRGHRLQAALADLMFDTAGRSEPGVREDHGGRRSLCRVGSQHGLDQVLDLGGWVLGAHRESVDATEDLTEEVLLRRHGLKGEGTL